MLKYECFGLKNIKMSPTFLFLRNFKIDYNSKIVQNATDHNVHVYQMERTHLLDNLRPKLFLEIFGFLRKMNFG